MLAPTDETACIEQNLTLGLTSERHLDRVSLGWPTCREPRPTRVAENQRSRFLSDEGEAPLSYRRAVPELEPELATEPCCESRWVADESELGDAT